MNTTLLKEELFKYAHSLGIDAIGIAPWPLPSEANQILSEDTPCPFTRGTLEERLTAASQIEHPKALIVCLFPYYQKAEQTNLAKYTWGDDYHLIVPQYLEKLGQFLVEQVSALHADNINYTRALSTEKPIGVQYEIHCDTSPLADRYGAYLAGLGFYGKNRCLINPTFGSFTNIGSLLVNIALPPDSPLKIDCGECNRCIKVCPGQSLNTNRFQFETCKSYLTQKKGELTKEEINIIQKTPLIFGCDVCQDVCPYNAAIPITTIPEFTHITPFISAEEIETLTNREFKSLFGHKAFSWRGKKLLLRNLNIIKERL